MGVTLARVTIGGMHVRGSWPWLVAATIVTAITAESLAPTFDTPRDVLSWYALAGLAALLVVASIAAHDLAHIVAAQHAKTPLTAIEPPLFGALPESALWADHPGAEARVAVAGPLTSLILAAALLTGASAFEGTPLDPATDLLGFVGLANLALAVLNLLPGYPLDGGRLLRAFFWYLSDDRVAGTRVAAFYGQIMFTFAFVGGFLLIALGEPYAVWGAWALLIVWSVTRAGREGMARTVWGEVGKDITISDIGLTSGIRVDADQSIDNTLDDLLLATPDGLLLVVDGDRVVGTVSMARLRKIPRKEWSTRPLRDVTVTIDDLPRIDADLTVAELFRVLDAADEDIVLVEARGRVVSAVVRRSAIRKLHERLAAQRRSPPVQPH